MLTVMKTLAVRMLSSLKFWTTILGIVSTWLAKKGIVVDPAMAQYIAGFFALLLLGQGLADTGTGGQGSKLPVVPPVPPTVKKDFDGTGEPLKVVTPPTQGGFIRLDALCFILFCGALLVGIVGVLACGAAHDCKDPANMNSAQCTVINSGIDCTKDELPAVVQEFGPVVKQIIEEATGADGTVDWAHVEKTLSSLGGRYGMCVLGSVIENYLVAPPKLAPGEVVPTVSALRAGLLHAKTTLWHVAPDTKIHLKGGDL